MADFARHFGIQFRDPDLLSLALTHRSYLSVTGKGDRESNERLEFLGDSVLGLVTSEYLYRTHPSEHEGQLTKTKSLLVSKAILARRALAMGLGRFVFMSHSEVESGGRQRLSILADAFESVIGAIYLDQGFEAARAFIHRWLLSEATEISQDKRHTNYKSHLQEYVQSTYRTHPVYRIRSEVGPDHSKQFIVEVLVGRRTMGQGKGRNKKEAEQAAARDALENVQGGRSETRSRTREPRSLDADPPARDRDAERAPRPAAGATATVDDDDDAGPVEPRRRPRRRERDAGAPAPRAAVEPPAPPPVREQPADPVPAWRDRSDEWEVGRPEGPLEERHVDPYAIAPEAPDEHFVDRDFGRSVVSPSRPVPRPLPAEATPLDREAEAPPLDRETESPAERFDDEEPGGETRSAPSARESEARFGRRRSRR